MTVIELMKAIALLCQLNVSDGSFLSTLEERQLKCQKYYAECMQKNINEPLKCIVNKK